LKVYLSVPMIANRNPSRAQVMSMVVEEAGHEVTSPWVLGPISEQQPVEVNVFERDSAGAENCDLLLADVSSPSTGVGMEIMAAHNKGKRILLVAMKGSRVSRMLSHMRDAELLTFADDAELVTGLRRALAVRS
jgi:2'-deoxynucleoside 5'-phosphate N-hydrolase